MNYCRFCESKLEKMFDLGTLSLGYPIENKELDRNNWTERFDLKICYNCYLGQTTAKIPYDKLRDENHYTTVSKQVKSHMENFHETIESIIPPKENPLILELGPSDGYLAHNLKSHGYKNIIGVEPSPHPNVKYDFELIEDFFNDKVVNNLKNNNKIPDIIICYYIIPLVPDLNILLRDITKLMKDGSYIIVLNAYLNDFFKKFRVDGFAHLRSNWLTANWFVFAMKKYGLEVVEIRNEGEFRGGTILVIAKKIPHPNHNLTPKILNFLEKEKAELTPERFNDFRKKLIQVKKNLLQQIKDFKKTDMPILAYGGGLKAATLVNWLGLTYEDIQFTVDADPNKQRKIIPQAKIPIKPVSDLFDRNQPVMVLMLALDAKDEIEFLLKEKLQKGSQIVYLIPDFKIITIK